MAPTKKNKITFLHARIHMNACAGRHAGALRQPYNEWIVMILVFLMHYSFYFFYNYLLTLIKQERRRRRRKKIFFFSFSSLFVISLKQSPSNVRVLQKIYQERALSYSAVKPSLFHRHSRCLRHFAHPSPTRAGSPSSSRHSS